MADKNIFTNPRMTSDGAGGVTEIVGEAYSADWTVDSVGALFVSPGTLYPSLDTIPAPFRYTGV